MDASATLPALLGPDDPAPWRAVNESGRAPVLLICDHASNRVPAALGDLGLAPERLGQHIGWDIGAAAVTERLAAALDAPAFLTGFSRLVIDCNRHPGGAGSIPEVSDGVEIPANQGLSPADAGARIALLFEPYHRAIAARLDGFEAAGTVPAILSIHSFTPTMSGRDRPWHAGVLWDSDPRLAVPLLAALSADPAIVVGDNEPYSARDPHGYSMAAHGGRRGLPHVLIELRQDLIADPAGASAWADRLARTLPPILSDPTLRSVRYY